MSNHTATTEATTEATEATEATSAPDWARFSTEPIGPCEHEDSVGPCYWDAAARGNGLGQSFVRTASGREFAIETEATEATRHDNVGGLTDSELAAETAAETAAQSAYREATEATEATTEATAHEPMSTLPHTGAGTELAAIGLVLALVGAALVGLSRYRLIVGRNTEPNAPRLSSGSIPTPRRGTIRVYWFGPLCAVVLPRR